MSLRLDTRPMRQSAENIIRNTAGLPPEMWNAAQVASIVKATCALAEQVKHWADWADTIQDDVERLEAEVARLSAEHNGRCHPISNLAIQD